MKTLLLGGTDLTMALLKAIVDSGHQPVGVVSVPKEYSISYNAKAKNSRFVDIESVCKDWGIPHFYYNKNIDDLINFTQAVQANFCLVAGWYFMLPERFRNLFEYGCLGLHASLLPQLRGAAPLNWAILNNFKETGVSLFEIVKGVDEGRLYAQKAIPLDDRETITSLVRKAEQASIEMVLSSLDGVKEKKIKPKEQAGVATYSCPRSPEDSMIDWSQDSQSIDKIIRASCKPYQGAYSYLDGQKIVIWEAIPVDAPIIYGRPGQICRINGEIHPYVICGVGSLKLVSASLEDGQDASGLILSKNYMTFGECK